MSQQSWSKGLTDEQAVAASQTGAHARLLAGPGTGKTHTLARRVVYLVSQEGVLPSQILVLTFTRMAASELRSKIGEHLAPYSEHMPHISTLHSFALRQLRRNSALIDSLPQPLRIADDWEESEIIRNEMKILAHRNLEAVKNSFNRLSADWEKLVADESGWLENLPDPQFVGAWEDHRRVYGYTLRAELVYRLKKAMEQIPEFTLQPGFQHVLIDEYQDLNPCDLAVAGEIAARGGTLLACGDDDQSIYGFRYADPSGIRDFVEEFPGALDLQLTECQRCDSAILAAALAVARQDPNRVDKPLHAVEGRPAGEVHLLSFATGTSEAEGIARLCRQLIASGLGPDKILILVRSDRHNVFSGPLLQTLMAQGVKATTNTGKMTVLAEPKGRRLLSMLQIVANPYDHLAWRARMQVTNGIGAKTIEAVYEFAAQEGIRFSDAIRRIPEFEDQIPTSSRSTLNDLVTQTLAIAERYHEEASNGDPELEHSGGDLIAKISSIAAHEITDETERNKVVARLGEICRMSDCTSIQDLLLSVALGREELEPELEQDHVNILTMHKAKGLSADAVFIMAAENEIMPHKDSARELADDRRLLYVSMTRARHKLFISYSRRRTGRQIHTGRNSGNPQRHLTQFLRNGPLRPENGENSVIS